MSAPLMTVKDLAGHLNVSEAFIHQRIRNKSIPVVRLGRAVRFDSSAIDEWLRSQMDSPASADR